MENLKDQIEEVSRLMSEALKGSTSPEEDRNLGMLGIVISLLMVVCTSLERISRTLGEKLKAD